MITMLMFLIDPAYAQNGPTQGGGIVGFLPLIVLCIVFYFLLIRPQMRQAKEHKKMLAALVKNDEVVTNGGVLGIIKQLGDDFISIEIAKDVEIKVQRNAISTVMPKGTLKLS